MLEDARRTISLVRMHQPPGDMPPLHVHEREDEGFYVLSGSLTLWVGDAAAGEARARASTRWRRTASRTPTARAPRARSRSSRRCRAASSAFVREAGAPALRPELPVLDGPPDAERLAPHRRAPTASRMLGPPGMLPARADAAPPEGADPL